MNDESTFADFIEDEADGKILACVIGGDDGRICSYKDVDGRDIPADKCGVVLAWSVARPLLAYKWDHGFGGADCHPICAWTADKIVYVSEYDGSTSVRSLPRNPESFVPGFA